MATSSFTKNFTVSKRQAQKFVENLNKEAPKTKSSFLSKFTHPDRDRELLKKALS